MTETTTSLAGLAARCGWSPERLAENVQDWGEERIRGLLEQRAAQGPAESA